MLCILDSKVEKPSCFLLCAGSSASLVQAPFLSGTDKDECDSRRRGKERRKEEGMEGTGGQGQFLLLLGQEGKNWADIAVILRVLVLPKLQTDRQGQKNFLSLPLSSLFPFSLSASLLSHGLHAKLHARLPVSSLSPSLLMHASLFHPLWKKRTRQDSKGREVVATGLGLCHAACFPCAACLALLLLPHHDSNKQAALISLKHASHSGRIRITGILLCPPASSASSITLLSPLLLKPSLLPVQCWSGKNFP